MITLTNVHHQHRLGNCGVSALTDVNLVIMPGEFIAVTGPSGSGKTTLLNVIGCMMKPQRGQVEFDHRPISNLSDPERSRIRREQIGFVFQSFNLLPALTVRENIEYPLRLCRQSQPARTRRIGELAEAIGVAPYLQLRPDQLSGGQRQRVAIARAVAMQPRLLIADEPTSNLDSACASQIMALFSMLNHNDGTAIVLATHDDAVSRLAKRHLRLHDGQLL